MILVTTPSADTYGNRLAGRLGAMRISAILRKFGDGECAPVIPNAHELAQQDVVVLSGTQHPQAENVLITCAVIAAARNAGARRIIALVPYLAFARQDREDVPGAAITGPVVVDLLGASGAEMIVTIDVHEQRSYLRSATPLLSIDPAPAKTAWVRSHLDGRVASLATHVAVVSPDRGGADRAGTVAALLGVPLVVCDKRKAPNGDTSYALHDLRLIRERTCVVVDDLASSGSTLVPLNAMLQTSDVGEVIVCLTHMLATADVLSERVGVSVWGCNTVEGSGGVIDTSELVADALHTVLAATTSRQASVLDVRS